MRTHKQLNGGPVAGFFSDAGSIVGNFVPGAGAAGSVLDSIFGGGKNNDRAPNQNLIGQNLENGLLNIGGHTESWYVYNGKRYKVEGGDVRATIRNAGFPIREVAIHVDEATINSVPYGGYFPPPQNLPTPQPQQAQTQGNQGQMQMSNSVGVSKGLKYGIIAAGGLALAAVGYMVFKPKKKKSLGALTPGLPKKKAAKQRAAVFAKLDSEGKAFPKNKSGVRAKPRKAAKRKATGKKKVRRVKL